MKNYLLGFSIRKINQNDELKKQLLDYTKDCPDFYTTRERYGSLVLGYIPVCKNCGIPVRIQNSSKWSQYCSTKCSNSSNEKIKKTKKTNLEKYGSEITFKSEEIKEKIKQTNLNRYGVENHFRLNEVQERIKQINLERYGVQHPAQNDLIKEKMKKTCLERYGEISPTQSKDIINKMKENNLEKYGVENLFQLNETKIKAKQTMIDRYGVIHSSQVRLLPIIHLIESQDWWNQWGSFGEVRDYLSNWLSLSVIYRKAHQYRPDWDFRSAISSPHQRINNLLDSLNIQYETNTKQIIAPLELDIFLPEHNLAIEVNGLYWHSELAGNKPKDYHLNKFLQCQAKGIRLLQFWDSEINDSWGKSELVIKGYLGLLDYSGPNKIEEGTRIIKVDNRFPWDYSGLGFTLVEQTEPRCWYTDYQDVYEEPGQNRERIWDCGCFIWKKQ